MGEGQGEGPTVQHNERACWRSPLSLTLPHKGGVDTDVHYDASGNQPNAINAPAVSVSQISDNGRNTFHPNRIN